MTTQADIKTFATAQETRWRAQMVMSKPQYDVAVRMRVMADELRGLALRVGLDQNDARRIHEAADAVDSKSLMIGMRDAK